MRFSTLDQWLKWQEVCHPLAIDLGLERVAEVARRLNLIEAASRRQVITIAGTNGKGSCVRTLEALLELEGQSYASYTSPHIVRYNERIRLFGVPASDEILCTAFDVIDQARGDISLTYFEFGTLAALWLFDYWQVDFWILEVGLGGRLDAANIIAAKIAVITSIDLDHTEWLGSTRELIGVEKAGICRPNRPLVCVDPDPPLSVLTCAKQLSCPVVAPTKTVFTTAQLLLGTDHYDLSRLQLPLPSVVAALLVMAELRLLSTAPALVQQTLEQINLPGRLQLCKLNNRQVWLDVAHNPAAVRFCVATMRSRNPELLQNGVDIVLAMMSDKDHEPCVAALAPVAASWSICELQNNPRAMPAAGLKPLIARHSDHPVAQYSSVAKALEALQFQPDTLPILILGSFYTVAEATEYLTGRCLEWEKPFENLG